MALPRRRLSTPLRALRTSRCIDIAREDWAQSTVEAAFLLPTFLTLILLALQPVCRFIRARSWSLPPPRPRGS